MEILACPHCDRLFRTNPHVLGKKIRCRGCQQIFHVPHDTTNVPLSPSPGEGEAVGEERSPPLAVACVKNGRDARCCPSCGRTFAMQSAFVDKTIRCRGCQAPFRVAATPASTPAEPPPREPALPRSRAPAGPPASSNRVPPLVSPSLPTVFDDVGAVLGAILPGERVASVVRPRKLPPRTRTESTPAATLVAILLGGACAVPVVLVILKSVAPEQYQEVIRLLPPFLRFGTW